ncbi:MAG: hypothetical protein E7F16_14905 [Enterococcus casseliflavus]|nr:hypothetical protein [Enterococcus casseliflavus]
MSGKLIIQGKAWGEFENAKRSKGNIEISGYRSYGGTHTVRMVDQPQLNDNQQIVLDYLKDKCNVYSFIAYKPFEAILRLNALDPEKTELEVKNTIDELTYKQQAQVLQAFSQWALEQEEV